MSILFLGGLGFLCAIAIVIVVFSLKMLVTKEQEREKEQFITNREIDITPYEVFSMSRRNLITFNEFRRAINEYNRLIYVPQEMTKVKRLSKDILAIFDRMTFHLPYEVLRNYAQRMKYELTTNLSTY